MYLLLINGAMRILNTIFITIFIYCNIFNTIKMGLKNYSSSIIVAFICSISYELIKLARYTTVKGVKKNVKNNKRNKRSKSNNS